MAFFRVPPLGLAAAMHWHAARATTRPGSRPVLAMSRVGATVT